MLLDTPSSKSASAGSETGDITLRVIFGVDFPTLFGAREKVFRLPRASNVSCLLDLICDTTERREAVMTGTEVSGNVVILRNGAPVRSKDELARELSDGDTIAIFPLLAGG